MGPRTQGDVHSRRELFSHLYSASGGDHSLVLACMCAYSPPAHRLIVRSLDDFAKLGVTVEEVHAAGDESFWAYGDYNNVITSFSKNPDDPERRVLGFEGIATAADLKSAICSGQRSLKLGHLSLKMMNGKVGNGEWHWIDEAACIMFTATSKPAFLRDMLATKLRLSLRVLRHEKFIEGSEESLGDLIIFDIDKSDVRRPTGNKNVFCQNASNYTIKPYETLSEDLRGAVAEMLTLELRPTIRNDLIGGSDAYFLAKVSQAGVAMYQMPPQISGATEPCFRGTVQAFNADCGDEVAQQMQNSSLLCGHCEKSCAVNLTICNGCGSPLEEVPVKATENVLMGFVYGVERGEKIPYTVSVRSEDATTLVYDDLLARSPCHLNAIPTEVHLSDWRSLLACPDEALLLLSRLEDACLRVVETQFWDYEPWRSSVLRPGAVSSAAEFKQHAMLALNAVPSQYQLHLHCIMPPLLPENYHKHLLAQRFTKYRWLPLEYVYPALRSIKESGGLPNVRGMEHEQIFAHIEAQGGPSYENIYEAELRRYTASHQLLANWQPECFEQVVVLTSSGSLDYDICALDRLQGSEKCGWCADLKVEGADQKKIEKSDKQNLQSYGRPYSSSGSPAPASYYSFAKRPGEVMSEKAWLEQRSK